MINSLTALRAFARVARTGSFSRAAKELGVPQPSVSRAVAELERELSSVLLTRTTRQVILTEAGEEYLARIEPILVALDEAGQALRGSKEVRGKLRVAVPVGIGMREIIPRLPEFVERHPSLQLELLLKDEWQDLLKDGIDVAIRLGKLKDSAATARVVGVNHRVVAASPAYLRRAGTPQVPEDLVRHRVVVGPPGASGNAWTFERDGKKKSITVQTHLKLSVNEAATTAAVAGLGILSSGLWGCREELASGALVRVLPEWSMEAVEAHAVFPAGRAAKLAARLFVSYVSDVLGR
jgi:DNA-binding transcriptional LysR family regulator